MLGGPGRQVRGARFRPARTSLACSDRAPRPAPIKHHLAEAPHWFAHRGFAAHFLCFPMLTVLALLADGCDTVSSRQEVRLSGILCKSPLGDGLIEVFKDSKHEHDNRSKAC